MKRSTQQDRKKQKISLMTVLAVAAAVVVVASVALLWVFRSGEAAGAQKKALQIGDETYSVAQVNFFYFSALDELLENANGYSELLGLDAGQDLSAQACPLSDSDESWKAYLLRQAEEGLQKVSVLCAEAERAGGTSARMQRPRSIPNSNTIHFSGKRPDMKTLTPIWKKPTVRG